MAIKAGRVGLDPKYVTPEGAPVSNTDQIELEIEQLQASKVGIGQLKANSKNFYFAYDATSQKYGYKLDGTGDFIPFEEGGIGWVPPKNLSTDLITISTQFTYTEGGIYVDESNDLVYVDLIAHKNSQASSTTTLNIVTALDDSIVPKDGFAGLSATWNNSLDAARNYDRASNYTCYVDKSNKRISFTLTTSSSGTTAYAYYYHVWGTYIRTTPTP